jgi:hypothetical protein
VDSELDLAGKPQAFQHASEALGRASAAERVADRAFSILRSLALSPRCAVTGCAQRPAGERVGSDIVMETAVYQFPPLTIVREAKDD